MERGRGTGEAAHGGDADRQRPYYDVFSASALDDLDRLKALARETLDIAPALGGADMTPLHLAADENHTEMIWLLASRGAHLNAVDARGRTPLHRATYCGCLVSAEVLIVLGAEVRRRNGSGRTALEVARKDRLFLRKA